MSASRSAWSITVVQPALLTRMSSRPKCSIVRAISALPCAWSVMSACTYKVSVGSDSATASPASTDDAELTTTRHPSSASRRAVASPMPLDESGDDRNPAIEVAHCVLPCQHQSRRSLGSRSGDMAERGAHDANGTSSTSPARTTCCERSASSRTRCSPWRRRRGCGRRRRRPGTGRCVTSSGTSSTRRRATSPASTPPTAGAPCLSRSACAR